MAQMAQNDHPQFAINHKEYGMHRSIVAIASERVLLIHRI
jgi:hypothetical protein